MPESSHRRPRKDLPPQSENSAARIAGAFFDKTLKTSHLGVDQVQMAQHRQVFVDFYQGEMGQLLELTGNNWSGQENPLLVEIFSILSSVERNKNVYYQPEDIAPIFNAIGAFLYKQPRFINAVSDFARQRNAKPDEAGGIEMKILDYVNQEAREFTSIQHYVALPVVKRPDGSWFVAEPDFFTSNTSDVISVLEVMRQDNMDKSGSNKYRFRRAEYVRQKDEQHPKGTRFSWNTTHWYEEPNFWSGNLRSALSNFSTAVTERFGDQGVSTITISMGGIAKGTAAPGTDIDTKCYVFYSGDRDPAELEESIRGVFAEQMASLPFSIKEGEGLALRFVNTDTMQAQFQSWDKQFYDVGGTEQVDADGKIHYDISSSEIGVFITTNGASRMYIKPADRWYKNVDIAIRGEGLEVTEIPAVA